jgi:ceramide synthetase
MDYSDLNHLFWNEKFWFPPNITWDQFESTDNFRYASPSDLTYVVPLAVMLSLIRFLLTSYVFEPIAKIIGVKGLKVKHPESNEVLKKAYISMKYSQKNRSQKNDKIMKLAQDLDMPEKKICQWFRDMEKYIKSNKKDNFTKCAWEMTFYTLVSTYGLVSLWKMSWFWNINDYVEKFPFHAIETDIWWLYILILAFYAGDLYSVIFIDVFRKDRDAFIVHHLVALVNLTCQFVTHFTRLGAVCLVLHELCNILLQPGRMLVYTGCFKMARLFLVIFSLFWCVTRLAIAPYIVGYVIVNAPNRFEPFPVYYLMIVGFLCATAMNLIWCYLLLKVLYKELFKAGTFDTSFSDPLSDSDEEISNDFKKQKIN